MLNLIANISSILFCYHWHTWVYFVFINLLISAESIEWSSITLLPPYGYSTC